MHSRIYQGLVSHQRHMPKAHGFQYRIFMMYLDLDELPGLFDKFLFWSCKRPALAWFRNNDHNCDSQNSLKNHIQSIIKNKTGKCHQGPVSLLTHLRYFGYCMNPVSFYYCWNETRSNLEFVVAEVNNTPWGETHYYVFECDQSGTKTHTFIFDKEFHVSPFMNMEQKYKWQMNTPNSFFKVNMTNFEDGEKVFQADMCLQEKIITHKNMAKVLILYPFMTATVITAIYWHAFILWLKRTPFYTHPKYINKELIS